MKKDLSWEDCVQDIVSIPAKVANAVRAAREDEDVPSTLEYSVYLNGVCKRIEVFVKRISQ